MLAPYGLVIVNYYDLVLTGEPVGRPSQKRADGLLSALAKDWSCTICRWARSTDGPTTQKMSGGNWRPNQGHHSAAHDFAVDIKDPDNPIMSGLKSPLMIKMDELFANPAVAA